MSKRKVLFTIAIVFSLLFHAVLLILAGKGGWLVSAQTPPEPVYPDIELTFPENKPRPREKPRTVVKNQNENNETPRNADLLSEQNSRARNPEKTNALRENSPMIKGNSSLVQDLYQPSVKQKKWEAIMPKGRRAFSADALVGKQVDRSEKETNRQKGNSGKTARQQRQASFLNASRFQQKQFSVNEVGAMSLSTYKWAWASYINKLKSKHQSVWFAPPAYNRLGLIHGQTKIYFEISRDGKLLKLQVLDHKGHDSLKDASVASIKALFPFAPLPPDFPDEKLGITATLYYPDLRKGR